MVSKKEKEKLAEAEKSEADEENLEKCNEGKKVEKTDPPEDADEEERMQDKKKKKSVEKEVEDEEEEEEETEEKKKKKVKKAGASLNPEESGAESNTESHTTTPGLGVPSKPQDVFVPSSDVDGKREQSTPMGKSVSPDLLKSPLFVQVTKQMDAMQDVLTKKVDALQKSVEDRMKNIKSDMEKVEKFYSQSFNKAISEEMGPESIQAVPISKQIEDGKVRFKNK